MFYFISHNCVSKLKNKFSFYSIITAEAGDFTTLNDSFKIDQKNHHYSS